MLFNAVNNALPQIRSMQIRNTLYCYIQIEPGLLCICKIHILYAFVHFKCTYIGKMHIAYLTLTFYRHQYFEDM